MDETRNRNLPNIKLANRQVDVIRRNLVCVCRFAIKNLIDRASYVNIDDDCEEFLNFCAVIEQVLLHRVKSQKTWYGGADLNFWNYISAVCYRVPNSCISSIAAIENIKSPAAKGRAFIRCALMEKRLSEYLSAALMQPKLTRKFYNEGAIMLSEDASVLCDVLLGLNAIDFSFCLKGENSDLLGPLAVDYTPFLKFHQSSESVSRDLEEMQELSNSSLSSSIMSEDVDEATTMKLKLSSLQQKYRNIVEQKGYLEELVRLRDQQNKELQDQYQSLVGHLRQVEVTGHREHLQLENVILELQGQLVAAKSEHRLLQQRLSLLMQQQRHREARDPPHDPPRDIQMMEMAGQSSTLNRHFADSLNDQQSVTSSTDMQHHTYLQNDTRSLVSDTSSQFTSQEDSHSLIPLAGSLTEVPIRDLDQAAEDRQNPGIAGQAAEDRQNPGIAEQAGRSSATPGSSLQKRVVVDDNAPLKKAEDSDPLTKAIASPAASVKGEVAEDTSNPVKAVGDVATRVESSSTSEVESSSLQLVTGGHSTTETEDEEFYDMSSPSKFSSSGKDRSSDMQDRMNVSQYYSITTLDEIDESMDENNGDHDDGTAKDMDKSKISDSGKFSEDNKPKPSDIDLSASGNVSESQQNLDKAGSKTSSEGIEGSVKDKTEGRMEGTAEPEMTEAVGTSKDLTKSSSSDGSDRVQVQKRDESSSSDDKDPWEMVGSGNGNGNSSDENAVESSPGVPISEELLAQGEVLEKIPEQKNSDQ